MHSITFIAAEAYISIENRILNECKQYGEEPTQEELAKAVSTAIGIMKEIDESRERVIDYQKWKTNLNFYTADGERIVLKEDNE